MNEFANIKSKRAITESEIKSAKDGIFRGFPAQFETRSQILGQLGRLVLFGLPNNYYHTIMSKVEALTLGQLHSVAKTHIDNHHLALMVVGDREEIEDDLKTLDIPIINVSVEGRPI